jgi:RNA recognition motif-containing protein
MPKTLFLCNLHYQIGTEDLYQLFGQYGRIKSAHVTLDCATGLSRGFGFVTFHDATEASNAIAALDGYAWHGRAIHVEEAKTSRIQMRPAVPEEVTHLR